MSDNHNEISKPTYYLAEEFEQFCEVGGGVEGADSRHEAFMEFCSQIDLTDLEIAQLRVYLNMSAPEGSKLAADREVGETDPVTEV